VILLAANKFVVIGLVLLVVIAFLFVANSSKPGNYDKLAQCLSAKGAKMYGAYWCSHCADQKKEFGTSFKYIDYIECDPQGANSKTALCQEMGVQGYPTWIINGQLYPGKQSFDQLASYSGCSLN
jgi:hypothetical protein